MATEVSSLVRILNGYLDEQRVASTSTSSAAAKQEGSSSSSSRRKDSSNSSSNELITRDLFGVGSHSYSSSSSSASTTTTTITSNSRNKNLGSFTKDVVDLDLEVPSGWEKRLDLKSGKVYLQRSESPISISSSTSTTSTTTSSDQQQQRNQTIQDLNCLPSSDDSLLDLKLVQYYDYGSVCTLDKVKSALERAEKAKKRSLSSTTSKSSSMKDDNEEDNGRSSTTSSNSSGLLFAGGCPSCLMYVMISKTNPKCPRCNSIVPTPLSTPIKKPKLDLNLNLLSSSSW